MMKLFLTGFVFVLMVSCRSSEAENIVNMAIENAGGDLFDGKTIDFDFRDRHYRSWREGSAFRLERITIDSGDTIRDELSNEGFKRFSGDVQLNIPDSMAVKYSNSVNAVHYFAYLPYKLNDDAVNVELEGDARVRGKDYYKVKVWFDKAGGGEDNDDIFYYWIDKISYSVDYFAYQYFSDGGGKRFREAFNQRIIKGIKFSDYVNFEPTEAHKDIPISKMDSLYQLKQLRKLSLIEMKNIKVEVNKN